MTGPSASRTLLAVVAALLPAGAALFALGGRPAPPSWQPVSEQPRQAAGNDDPVATHLLARSLAAGGAQAYSGTQLVTTFSEQQTTSALAQVDHRPGRGATVVVRPSVVTGGSETQLQPDTLAGVAPEQELELLTSNYDLRLAGADQVAGRGAEVVEVVRREQSGPGAVAARVWVDVGCGLVLRRELLDGAGRLLMTSAFVSIEVEPLGDRALPVAARGPAAADPGESQRWRARGAVLPDHLPGGLALVQTLATTDSHSKPVLQLVYSDGLVTVSVFQQPGHLEHRSGWVRAPEVGPDVWLLPQIPTRLAWSRSGMTFTVVSEAGRGVLEQSAAAFPLPAPSSSVLARFGRGLTRVGSWLDPTG